MLKKPNEHQLNSIASIFQEEFLYNWDTATIAKGIQRVRTNEIGSVTDVYLSSGLYAKLCDIHYGNWRRKPFEVNGFRVSQWQARRPE